jgi:hypothetical protein
LRKILKLGAVFWVLRWAATEAAALLARRRGAR